MRLILLKVSAAASVVSQALADLLQHVRQYTSRGEPIGRYDQATDTIMTVTESIFSSMGDAGESKRAFSTLLKAIVYKTEVVNKLNSTRYYIIFLFLQRTVLVSSPLGFRLKYLKNFP